MQLAEFIEEFKDSITEKTMQAFQPLYCFDLIPYQEKIRKLLRKPFASQTHCIAGLVKAYEKSNSAFIVGEMGVGKTLIGIAVPFIAGFKKVLIICPPHLTKKWEREIKQTVASARVFIVKNTNELEKAIKAVSSISVNYFIISREQAKLTYYWKPAYWLRLSGYKRLVACPDCGQLIANEESIPLTVEDINKKKLRCKNVIKEKVCGASLWQADKNGPRRYSLAEYIKKYYKKYFDFLILDECHEYKARGSAQGFAIAALASASKRVLAMTGTLFGGYATSLFYLLYRLTTDFKESYGHNDSLRFAEHFGILERVYKEKSDWLEDGTSSKRRRYYSRTVEKPGVSPQIITHLIDKTAFLRLADVSEALPPYQDIVETIQMEEEQASEYHTFASTLKAELVKELTKGSKRLLGAYLQSLLAYPDAPWRGERVMRQVRDEIEVVAEAPALNRETIYPKEKRIIELCLEEKRERRRIIIYCIHTETRDITERLKEILEREGLKIAVLKSHTTESEKREQWVQDKVKEGIDVLICHPKLVQTGLDLIDFPTLVFYQIEYSVYTLRQASRRSWRIGQKNHVKVYYLIYGETLQEKALNLIAKKVKASLMVEGELLNESLTAQANDEDVMTELAKSLVSGNKTKESAEELFSLCRQAHIENHSFMGHEMTPVTIEEIETGTEEPSEESETVEIGKSEKTVFWEDLRLEIRNKSRKRKVIENKSQLSFGF